MIIRCSGGRAYSSSIPVRFIPKKSSKIRESETSTQVKGAEVMKVSEKLKLESISLANTLVKVAEVKVVPNKLKLEPIGLENPPGARAGRRPCLLDDKSNFKIKIKDLGTTSCFMKENLVLSILTHVIIFKKRTCLITYPDHGLMPELIGSAWKINLQAFFQLYLYIYYIVSPCYNAT